MKNRKKVLITGLTTSFITTFMGSGLNLAIPAMEEEFAAGIRSMGWVVNVYMITCAALAVPFGWLADRFRRRKILLTGIFLFTAGSGLAVFAGELQVLLIFRFVQAVGAVMIFSTNTAMMAEVAGEENRGKAMGQAAGANYAGLAAGPVIGGLLTHNFGWRAIFAVTAAISGAIFIAGIFSLPEGKYKTSSGFPKEILTDKAYIFANLAAMINYGTNYIISYVLSVYLQAACGFNPQNAGFVLLTSTVVMTVLAPVSGKLSDKIRPQYLCAAGMAVCGLSLIMLISASQNNSIAAIICALAVSGAGFALFSSPNTNAVMSCVKAENYGFVSSVLSAMRSSGNALGIAVINTVTAVYIGSGELNNAAPEAIRCSMQAVYIVFTILCILGIFMAMKRKM